MKTLTSTHTDSSSDNKADHCRRAWRLTTALSLCCCLFTSCASDAPDVDMVRGDYERPPGGFDANPPSDAIVGKWVTRKRKELSGETYWEGLLLHEDGTGVEVDPDYDAPWPKVWAYQGGGRWVVSTPGDRAFFGKRFGVSHPSASGERMLYLFTEEELDSMKYTRKID
jgi:hypothetical protein